MIKAIVFDYGNVISEQQDSGCYARMAALSGLPTEFFMRAFWKYRPDFDRGSISGVEMYNDVLTEAGVKESGREALAKRLLDEDLGSWFHISGPVTDWGLSLQRQGYKLGILSNMPHDFLERYEERIELFRKADVAVFSCRVKWIKPEPSIYESLIQGLGCEPGEIVFFDDIQDNVSGARKAGINAFLWTGVEQAKKDWKGMIDGLTHRPA